MRRQLTSKTIISAAMVFAFVFTVAPVRAQLDETCKVTINNQTVNVGFGGEFRFDNLPTGPDLFRVYAICTKDGKTRYGRSGLFCKCWRVLSSIVGFSRFTQRHVTFCILTLSHKHITLNGVG